MDEYNLASVLYDSTTDSETFCWNNGYPSASFVTIGDTTLNFMEPPDIMWARYSRTTQTRIWAMIGGGMRTETILDAQLFSDTLGSVSTSSDVIVALTTTSATVTFGSLVLANPSISGLQSVVVMQVAGDSGVVVWAQIGGATDLAGCSITRLALSSSLLHLILVSTNYAYPSTTLALVGQSWTVATGNVFVTLLLETGAYHSSLVGDCLTLGRYVMTDVASDGVGAVFISGYYAQNKTIRTTHRHRVFVCGHFLAQHRLLHDFDRDRGVGQLAHWHRCVSGLLSIDCHEHRRHVRVGTGHLPPAAINADFGTLFLDAAGFRVGGLQWGGDAGDDTPVSQVYAWIPGGGLLAAVHTDLATIIFPSQEFGTVFYVSAGQQDAVSLEFLTYAPFTPWTVMGFGGPRIETVTGVIYNSIGYPASSVCSPARRSRPVR